MDRKEEIVLATLTLASTYGLKGISMSMIAERVGIKKPSLYKHFASKDEIINAMYQYLREESKKNINIVTIKDNSIYNDKNPYLLLKEMVDSYIKMNNDSKMMMFYKVIYSERSIDPMVAKIMVEETERMINATKYVFNMLMENKLLYFKDIEMSSISFAMTIHGLMDYELDKRNSLNENNNFNIDDYLKYFCVVNKYEK